MNQREFGQFEGLTYFSAALRAGLLLRPRVGHGRARTEGRSVVYDCGYSLPTQRAEVLGAIAAHLAAQDGGAEGLAADYRGMLDRAVLPALGSWR